MNNNKDFDLPSNALIIMVGLPGSGKSTLAKKIKGENTIIVSTDDIHEEFYGKMIGESENFVNGPEVFDEFYKRIREGIQSKKQVIADATSITNRRRMELYNIAIENSIPIRVIFMNVPLEQILKQNKQRDKNVPEDKIKASFEMLKYRRQKTTSYGKKITELSQYERLCQEIEQLPDAKMCHIFISPHQDKTREDR